VNEQETVDRIAVLAGPRVTALLRLRSVRHIYDPTPGALNSTFVENDAKVSLDKMKTASQPYKDIERFLVEEKVGQYIVGPGVLPVVTALSQAIMRKTLLVTRRLSASRSDRGVVAHVEGFGIRIMMHFDETAGETILVWQCLFGVL